MEAESPLVTVKKRLVYKMLRDLEVNRMTHKALSIKYKKMMSISDMVLITLSSVTLSTIILNNLESSWVAKMTATGASTLNFIGSAIVKTYELHRKYSDATTVYHQLTDIKSEVLIVLGKNHLSSEDVQFLLVDLQHRMALISERSTLVKCKTPAATDSLSTLVIV